MSRLDRIIASGFAAILVLSPCVVRNVYAAEGLETGAGLLITDVTLINQHATNDEVLVNILIRDNKLDIVTEDTIPADRAEVILDAEGEILLGDLKLGEKPDFLILAGDPRDNFELLINAGEHARLLVRDGDIVSSELVANAQTHAAPENDKVQSYLAPPMALATSYQDPTRWNHFDTKYVSGLFNGVVVLDGQHWRSQDAGSTQQVGDLNDFDGSAVRALEIGVAGTINFNNPWQFTVAAADLTFEPGFDGRESDDLQFRDYRVDIPLSQEISLAVGKQREPISHERIMSLARQPHQERSVTANTLLASRNVGVTLSGTGFSRRMTWAGGVFNDWLEDDGSLSDNATQYSGRLTWLPYITDDENSILHVAAGARYSGGEEGFRYATTPGFSQAPDFVDTGPLQADNTMSYALEAFWQRGPFWMGGEYVQTNMDAPALNDPTFTGYHVFASWLITGEVRGYNRRTGVFNPISVAKSVNQNGWGALEAVARWETVDLTDELVAGGVVDIATLGLTWWLTSNAYVSVNYRHIELDRFDLIGTSSGFNLRVLMMLL